jgi:hypothetical protein
MHSQAYSFFLHFSVFPADILINETPNQIFIFFKMAMYKQKVGV